MPSEKLKPRDPIKTSAYYLKVAKLYQDAIAAAVKLNSAAVQNTIAGYYLLVARALYSAGVSTERCKKELANEAEYFARHLSASKKEPHHGIPNLFPYLEHMSAACLTGSIRRCVEHLDEARIENVLPWQAAILSLIAAVFEAKDKPTDELNFKGATAEFGPVFTDLFLAVLQRDHERFPEKLESYLRQVWGPPMDRSAKEDLISKPPSYSGKWALFSAALCQVMGEVPALSRKALEYVPVDLVQVRYAGVHRGDAAVSLQPTTASVAKKKSKKR